MGFSSNAYVARADPSTTAVWLIDDELAALHDHAAVGCPIAVHELDAKLRKGSLASAQRYQAFVHHLDVFGHLGGDPPSCDAVT